MANGVKKLQKVQFGLETTPGTAVAAKTLYRGSGGALDDQRTLNKVEENVGLLSDTLRTNISKVLGMISLASSVASFEQIQHLFAMAFGGPTIANATTVPPAAGSGASFTAVVTAGVITAVNKVSGGAGYLTSPLIIAYGGGGSGADLGCSLTANSVNAVNINSGGTGYTSAPTILVLPTDGFSEAAIFQTTLPTSTLPTPTPYTITGGDNFETEQMEYGLVTKIDLTAESGDQLKVAADIMGRQVSYLNNTAAPTLLTPNPVEDILFQLCKVYLDNTSGTFGTTQVSSAIEGIKLTFEIKWKPEFTADGVLYYTVASFVGWSVKGELTYIHNTPAGGVSGAKSFFRNQTAKLLRLDFTGSTLQGTGSDYTSKHLIVDLPIKFEKPGVLDNKDGTSTVAMSFSGGYDFTAGSAGKVIVVTKQLYVLPLY